MSYSIGMMAKKENIKIDGLGEIIDNVRSKIDQNRIQNEYGSTSGFVFWTDSFVVPKNVDDNAYYEQINENIWIVKYLNSADMRLSGKDLLDKLYISDIFVKYVFYEETANWWMKDENKFDFSYCPPWNLDKDGYVMLSVRNTSSFVETNKGKKWIKKYGKRGGNSFLFSDKLHDLTKDNSLLDSLKVLVSDPEIQYRQHGIIVETKLRDGEIYLFESAWTLNPLVATHSVIVSTQNVDYYAVEPCVFDAVKVELKKLNSKIDNLRYLNFGEVIKYQFTLQ
ncbi:MAG: hypothetical protein WC069_01035 [Candidatus Shapirobacteria bacterium]